MSSFYEKGNKYRVDGGDEEKDKGVIHGKERILYGKSGIYH